MIVLPGIAAFVLFVLFDINKIKWHNRLLNLCFGLGALLLAASTLLCILHGEWTWRLGMIPALAAAAASAAALIYALFFALPFHDTYVEGEGVPVVSKGIYGWCRHPGFWPFLLLYLFLWLSFGGRLLLAAAICYPLCNGIYIYIQDRWIFPQFIQGYDAYRKAVPFLIPHRRR